MKFGSKPRFVFASRIAVFGDPMPNYVDDETPLTPKMFYGAHKAMMEQWLTMLTPQTLKFNLYSVRSLH